ncbi:MAG: lipoate--protein ligase family protein [Anaerolineales bacterium]|nr:lipoate--protein ligase family protein [Anaerolineales bacterium]
MDLYDLGTAPWQDSQALYHALAHLGREGLILVEPATPYVCLGCHQDAAQELDLEYITREAIPLFRREVGGGAVYLDRGQLFYQFVFRKDNPRLPAGKEALYREYLQPVVEAFNDLGVPAVFKPVNDIVANQRKISGNGAAEIGEAVVLVGNFIIDFNFTQMSRVLKVPDEKFRDKVFKTLSENLTTIPREAGRTPTHAEVAARLLARCEPRLGPFTPRAVDAELRAKADALLTEYLRPEWIFANDQRARSGTAIKIAEGVYVIQKAVKAPGGLIRAAAVNRHGRLTDVHLSGDFFFYPAARLAELERALEGVAVQAEAVAAAVARFYQAHGVETPGVRPEDFAQVLAA